jgi:hypothetical protein
VFLSGADEVVLCLRWLVCGAVDCDSDSGSDELHVDMMIYVIKHQSKIVV